MSDSPKPLHALLARQLRRSDVAELLGHPGLQRLLSAVSSAYDDFDTSRQMLERSLELSSQELTEASVELRALLDERSAAHAQRLEATGLLAGGVGHDFNNLLTVITAACDLQRELSEPDDPRLESVAHIEAAASRATALTRQLLAFSRQQVLEPRVIDLNRTIAGLEPICRPLVGGSIELRWTLEPELPAITADPSQIEQVVVNLVINARDAMPGGGLLELRTARASLNEAGALDTNAANLIRLSVSDTGSGMSSEVKARIFEPFFTTKLPGKGTGLGLSTVYGIVRQSGGYITVDSELEKGTTFHVFLPESAARAS